MSDFDQALNITFAFEGGYVNDPHDHGGQTKFGISKTSYPDEDIANLTRERAAFLYKRDYWFAAGCDALPWPLSLVVFDSAVLCGVGRARRWLVETRDPHTYLDRRRDFHNQRVVDKPDQARFLKGWQNRVKKLRTFIPTPDLAA